MNFPPSANWVEDEQGKRYSHEQGKAHMGWWLDKWSYDVQKHGWRCRLVEVHEEADETAPPPAVNPANPKQAFGDLKAAVQLVPPALMLGAAKALKEGAQKYGAYNWRSTKVEMLTYIGGAMRHLAALLDGEDVDPESTTGKLHIEGLAANAAILLDAWYGGFLIDNRPPKGPAPEMVRTPAGPGKK